MTPMDLDGKSVSILGLGSSGLAAAALSVSKGGKTYVSDLRADTSTRARAADLGTLGVDVELGGHDIERMGASDVVVVSPGISPDVPALVALRERGVGWLSEPEFAFHFLAAPVVAITGTNGKTTTAALAAHLLKAGGFTVGLGGNIGTEFGPAASLLALQDPVPDWFVLEMSSFQLADIELFKPAIGVVTNLAPDHLDRYDSLDAYYGDKAQLFKNSDSTSRWVLFDQPEVIALGRGASGTQFRFGLQQTPDRSAFVAGGVLTLDLEDSVSLTTSRDLQLLGSHNVENALAASLVAVLAGATPAAVRDGLKSFPPLPHRLERVGEANDVVWVNDSKATNVAATTSAIMSLDRPIVLLLGGVDKGESFHALKDALADRVRGIVAYGEVAGRAAEELAGSVPIVRGGFNFEVVVEKAVALSEPGDALLLSPATSSFDMFQNYVERGNEFRSIARNSTQGNR